MSRLDAAREELKTICEIIDDGEFLPGYRGHHEKRERLVAEVKDLEIEHAADLAGEAAVEFLRTHGQYLQEINCGGLPRSEIDDELDAVMARIAELQELIDAR